MMEELLHGPGGQEKEGAVIFLDCLDSSISSDFSVSSDTYIFFSSITRTQ